MAYTTIDNPELFFQTQLFSGNAGTNAITLDGSEDMQPDWVWLKKRNGTANHHLVNSVAGAGRYLYANLANAEGGDGADGGGNDLLASFNSDGFTLDAGADSNASGATGVAWCWNANGSGSSNSDGSITSSVSANTTAGFSIVSWSGSGANATIGHGLGAEPKIIFLKIRTGTNNWQVYSKSIGSGNALFLNTTDASGSNTGWQSTDATSSVFYVSGGTAVNGSGQDLIAYCFAEKKGYSKFGSYTGNGNADGSFINTGFKPAWFMIKSSSTAEDWNIIDNTRSPFNDVDKYLNANSNGAEATFSFGDFTANGIKLRNTGTSMNQSGTTYIYMAFAESPFVNSSGVPNNAR